MERQQRGFTLIELMIVVAIIGILAAIAVPQYQNYVARSQATEAVSLLGAIRTGVEERVVQTGSFPDGTTNGQRPVDFGANTNTDNEVGQYVDSISFYSAGAGAGCVIATMKAADSGDVSSIIAGDALTMYRDANGIWTPGAAGTTIDQEYLSATFQGNTATGTCSGSAG